GARDLDRRGLRAVRILVQHRGAGVEGGVLAGTPPSRGHILAVRPLRWIATRLVPAIVSAIASARIVSGRVLPVAARPPSPGSCSPSSVTVRLAQPISEPSAANTA